MKRKKIKRVKIWKYYIYSKLKGFKSIIVHQVSQAALEFLEQIFLCDTVSFGARSDDFFIYYIIWETKLTDLKKLLIKKSILNYISLLIESAPKYIYYIVIRSHNNNKTVTQNNFLETKKNNDTNLFFFSSFNLIILR